MKGKTKGTAATGRGTNTVKECDTSSVPATKGKGKGK